MDQKVSQPVSSPVQNFSKKQFVYGFLGGMVVLGAIFWIGSSISDTSSSLSNSYSISSPSYDSARSTGSYAPALSLGSAGTKSPAPQVVGNMTKDRTVTTNYVSAHVKSVSTYITEVTAFVTSVEGKIMNQSTSETSDDGSQNGTLQVLVPNKQADAFLTFATQHAVKVVDRNVNSYQVSQQYSDIERQLAQYEETYAKIKDYYKQAKSVDDLLRIQSQLDSTQAMIDSLKGQKRALDELSTNTQFTIYLSTNEYNLPYVPQGTFEVAKTFKNAVRSLVSFTDSLVKTLIYVLVFIPVIALFGGLLWVGKMLIKRFVK